LQIFLAIRLFPVITGIYHAFLLKSHIESHKKMAILGLTRTKEAGRMCEVS